MRTILRFALVAAAAALAFPAWQRVRPAPAVETVRPERREVVEVVVASCKLRARRQSDIAPEVPGVVESVAVEEGDTVTTGQELVRLRRADAERQADQARTAANTARAELARVKAGPLPEELDRAAAEVEREKAALRQKEQDFERLSELFAKNIVNVADYQKARNELDEARAGVAVAERSLALLRRQPRDEDVALAAARVAEAEAALAFAMEQLDKRSIRSALAGLVVARAAEPGQAATAGTGLLTIADMSTPEVYVETDENNLARLRAGQPAVMVAPAYRDTPVTATLRQIGPEIDYERGVVALRLTPGPLPEFARPEMTLDTSIEVARLHDALTVPVSAVVRSGAREHVVAVEGGRARHVEVRVVGRSTEFAAVEGLEESAAVALRGAGIADGARARPAAARAAGRAE